MRQIYEENEFLDIFEISNRNGCWIHSYDKVVLDDMEDLLVAGDNAVKAIADVHGTDYQCGSTGELLYPAAGGSHDFARGALGVKYAYVLELRDKGKNGFLLPQGNKFY